MFVLGRARFKWGAEGHDSLPKSQTGSLKKEDFLGSNPLDVYL